MTTLTLLQQAVIEQLGYDELDDDCKANLLDIMNHGVSGGFSGFIYYSETVKFFNDNRQIIIDELTLLAESLGESKYEMLSNFNCLGDDYTIDSVVEALNIPDHEDETQVKNALAWFAAEQVAYSLEEQIS